MEGKRVSYKDYELIVKSRSSSDMFFTEQNPITKFGTIVGLFENGKVCVKCDEDKMLRLFDIEKLEIVDEDIENFIKGDKI